MIEPAILGYVAGVFTTLAFLPQALKTLKTKNTEAISLTMYLMFVTGVSLWMLYGYSLHDKALIIANGLTLIFATPILILKIIHTIRSNRGVEPS